MVFIDFKSRSATCLLQVLIVKIFLHHMVHIFDIMNLRNRLSEQVDVDF